MWRLLIGRNGADRVPGSKLFRQLATGQIAAKCAKVRPRFGFENENSHARTPLQRYIVVVVGPLIHHRGSPAAELIALRRPGASRSAFVLVTKNQSPLFQI